MSDVSREMFQETMMDYEESISDGYCYYAELYYNGVQEVLSEMADELYHKVYGG